ncbi:SubName: Full=Probable exosome complex exonuclease rrp41 {ECO:0000313/EMBL:CCA66660.1} [Serendipita indica DSM 11827]|uniref:Ribosomal RNA-processing protein 41 n=1 Tax=Serendipita indica (strain DSM 11827) TaxID=1109443 RepID=G4T5S3_SERID|nr:SubName: Full=Probable exosome complex exonuclease rrp41 {ECO:0000313/EMBL:CCA66660.1} [Serendipita indica DSM 11827]CCA66660.1 probable exosome complex exonuclease rrp41 [Serendipita indica DSM 11827]
MSSRVEILNAGGYRSDGRTQYELRSLEIILGDSSRPRTINLHDSASNPHPNAPDGSAIVGHGLTVVSARVFGPREPLLRREAIHDRAKLSVQVAMLPFSGGMAGRRRGRGDKRLLELGAAIESTFESVVQTGLYPRSQIDIVVEIHQQDGGTLQAAINSVTLALTDAGVAMYDQVVAVSAGLHSTAVLLDLTHHEENDMPHLTVAVMPRSGKVTLLNMEARLHVTRFEAVFKIACEAVTVIRDEMNSVISKRTTSLVASISDSAGPRNLRAGNEMDE